MLEKKIINKFGKHYLLGADANGIKHWLEEPSWDCDWYWGFGYIHTFTNNDNPTQSVDISMHYHFDSFTNNNRNMYDNFKQKFTESVLTDKELWTLCELFATAYILRDYSDTLYHGGAHYTENPKKDLIKNPKEYDRINKTVLPAIFEEITKLLTPQKG